MALWSKKQLSLPGDQVLPWRIRLSHRSFLSDTTCITQRLLQMGERQTKCTSERKYDACRKDHRDPWSTSRERISRDQRRAGTLPRHSRRWQTCPAHLPGKGIHSTIKYRIPGCTKADKNPQHIAANLLRQHFHADRPDEIWLTDVTEFKWYEGPVVHKLYLSAILDLYDRRIVAYIISDRNDNPLVFDTFRQAVTENPDAHPIFHSDRGFQYTNNTFHHMLEEAGMTQSMSRKRECQDNGPIEGFWGILKRERYYGKAFYSRESLVEMIEGFIHYYNTERLQRKLGVVTPLEKNAMYYAAAWK